MADSEAPESPEEAGWRAYWPHVRAGLVLAHIMVMLALSTPDLGGTLSRKAWKRPTVQLELEAWADKLGRDPAELEEQLWGVATTYGEWRQKALRPVQPYSDYFGVRQRWRMFAAGQRVPARYEIDAKIDGKWEPIYRSRSDELDWRRNLFDNDRMRAYMYKATWPHNRKRYRWLCNWVAREVPKDYPDATKIRVRRWRYKTPPPELADKKPKGKYEGKCVRKVKR